MRERVVEVERLDGQFMWEQPLLHGVFIGEVQPAFGVPHPLSVPDRTSWLCCRKLSGISPDRVQPEYESKLAQHRAAGSEPPRCCRGDTQRDTNRTAHEAEYDCVVGGQPVHRCDQRTVAIADFGRRVSTIRRTVGQDVEMHDDRTLVEARIRRAVEQRIVPAVHGPAVPMTVAAFEVPGEPISFEEAMAASYVPFTIGAGWGKPWGTTWFKLEGAIPADWDGQEIEAIIDLGFAPHSPGFQSEGSVWVAAGGPRCSIHPMRRAVPLRDAVAGTTISMTVEAASNPGFGGTLPTPMGSRSTAGNASIYRLRRADLCVYRREVHALCLDIEVLEKTMMMLSLEDPRRHQILRALERAFDELDLDDVVGSAGAARLTLAPTLAVPARASAHNIVGVGHAHIDSAWLWPVRETVRKCSRTFSSAIELMNEYPEYKFVCSQAAQYDWMERLYPNVFADIVAKVDAGQWIPVGGMWVEADMNLPSGESIARQLVHGQRYFESRFGARCEEVWIPDVFGYPASLPQIFSAGGCDRFITQKLSWNKQNKMPHHTFRWFGIDGTSVLTHFPPVDTYNAEVDPVELAYAQANFSDKGWSNWSLMPFGYGDGGGGPTREMLERAHRTRDLDGLPRLHLGTPDDFFAKIEAEGAEFPIPEWHGELYFEMHRGTLTSQSNTKVGNRTCERLLREAELWWSFVAQDVPGDYPHATFDAIWKEVLLQQFHDIIPGSSIAWVYEDTAEVYARLVPQLEALIDAALQRLAPPTPTLSNSSTHRRDEIVVSDVAPCGTGATQLLVDGRTAFRAVVPGLALAAASAGTVTDAVVIDGNAMRNAAIEIRWNDRGELVSMLDRVTGRELFTHGQMGARIEIALDFPNEYDAWDLEHWSRRSTSVIDDCDAILVQDQGPLVGRVRVQRSFGDSALTQTYVMRAGSSRLDIELDIDWHEDERILSIAFPLDVQSDRVDCGIQFGAVSRPRFANTSWDAAKFEVCAHRWVDVSEPNFGVAVLDTGRYGHAIQGDAIRVTLQRAPKWPDPRADRGQHHTTVSLLPHCGDREVVVREAEALNEPLRVVCGRAERAPGPLVTVAHDALEVSAVKRADDQSGDLIVRVFERTGQRVGPPGDQPEVDVIGVPTANDVAVVGLLEDVTEFERIATTVATVSFRPYELRTLRFR